MKRLKPKVKGEIYIGFLPSESNPPTILEFGNILQYMAEFALDKVVYAVIDGNSSDEYFRKTRRHRLEMAKSFASIFEPLVQVVDLGDGEPCVSEEMAFQLFGFNPDMAFTLVYISREMNLNERRSSIERLGSNIGMRLHGFNDRVHRVVVVFRGGVCERLCGAEDVVSEYLAKDLLGVEYLDKKGIELPKGMSVNEILLSGIGGQGDIDLPLLSRTLLSRDVARYLTEHDDYRRSLAAYLSDRKYR